MAETMDEMATTHFNGAVPIKRARTELMAPESEIQLRRRKEAEKAYGRGRKISVKSVKDKKLRGNLKNLENKYKDAAMRAKDAEILLENTEGYLEPETELERTYKTTQDQIKSSVPIATAQMGFELKLDGGPYVAEYTRNGRELLLAGRKGHVATMEWRVSLENRMPRARKLIWSDRTENWDASYNSERLCGMHDGCTTISYLPWRKRNTSISTIAQAWRYIA
jgi:U3 small nucleolar RNA-associated protein 7